MQAHEKNFDPSVFPTHGRFVTLDEKDSTIRNSPLDFHFTLQYSFMHCDITFGQPQSRRRHPWSLINLNYEVTDHGTQEDTFGTRVQVGYYLYI